MSAAVAKVLAEFKVGLTKLYGERLRGVYLFGSYARGDADSDSDMDVLVVLRRFEAYGAEIDRTSELASEVSLKHGISVSRVFVSEQDWEATDSFFLANVREESIPA